MSYNPSDDDIMRAAMSGLDDDLDDYSSQQNSQYVQSYNNQTNYNSVPNYQQNYDPYANKQPDPYMNDPYANQQPDPYMNDPYANQQSDPYVNDPYANQQYDPYDGYSQASPDDFGSVQAPNGPIKVKYMISYLLFWLKGEIYQEKNFIRFKTPNTILKLIPLGSKKQSIPINQLSVVSTSFSLDFKSFLIGLIVTIIGIGGFVGTVSNSGGDAGESLGSIAIFAVITLLGVVMCLSAFETILTFETTSGKEIVVPFLVIQKKLAQEVEFTVNQFIENRMNDTNNRDQTDRIVDAINGRY